jgi:hypothetical protein
VRASTAVARQEVREKVTKIREFAALPRVNGSCMATAADVLQRCFAFDRFDLVNSHVLRLDLRMKTPQTQKELEEHLKEQAAFLSASASSYDNGFKAEAKRLATTLRVLLHDTANSTSLLTLLGCKTHLHFDDLLGPLNEKGLQGYVGVKMTMITGGIKYDPNLGTPKRVTPFSDWWDATMIFSPSLRLTRKSAVLNLANTAGGSHVDPKLDAQYATLARNDPAIWSTKDGPAIIENNPVYAAVRQVTHEVLGTLKRELGHLL